MLLVSLVCEPKNQPRATLGNDCAVNISWTLTNQHQTQAILQLVALPRDHIHSLGDGQLLYKVGGIEFCSQALDLCVLSGGGIL